MQDVSPPQVFVRNDKGRMWGPLAPQSLELLLDNGLIEGRIQLSIDGLHFAWPGRFEDLREFVPTALWGEGFSPPSPAASPPPRPAAAPVAGPGALQNAQPARPPPPVVVQAQATPPRRHGAPEGQETTAPGVPFATPEPTTSPGLEPLRTRSATSDHALQASGMPASGDLSRFSPIRLYYLAASAQLTGKLTAQLGDRQLAVHFRRGNPEHVASSHPDDAVSVFVQRERLVTPDQLSAALGALGRFGGDLVSALFGTGALNPSTAFAHLAQRAQTLMLRLVLADAGSFTWTDEELPAHLALPLGNRWGVLMDLVRKVPAAEIRRRMSNAADLPVMKTGGRVPLSELRLTPQETRAMGLVDGVRSLNLLARDLPQDADAFFRLAWTLRELDIVSFASTRLPTPTPAPRSPPMHERTPPPSRGPAVVTPPPPAAPAPVRASRPPPTIAQSAPSRAQVKAPPRATPPVMAPPAAAPPPPPPTQADHAADVTRLRTLLAKLKDQNHFEVLELTEKADSAQAKAAYFRLARVYHPDTVPPGAPPELAKLKADVFAKVGEAYRTLGEDGLRAQYLEELKSGGAGEVDVVAILRAEELFQRGCLLVKARRFQQALEPLNEAIGINAEEGEFYAWRGVSRFFTEMTTDARKADADANSDFEQALRLNPRCAAAWFFRGQIARVQGDAKKALGHFRKALDLQPDHLDAQREIRYLNKK